MVATAIQPHVLKNRIGAARIPHNVPVRTRIPNVSLTGSRRNPMVFFCHMGNLQVMDALTTGTASRHGAMLYLFFLFAHAAFRARPNIQGLASSRG